MYDIKFGTASRDHSGNMNPRNTGCHFTYETFDIFSLNYEYFAEICAHAHDWILETLFLNNEIPRSLYLPDIFIYLRHS